MFHYTPNHFLQSNCPIKILVVGSGGTGSQILIGLGKINYALMELGHEHGLEVTCIDPDHVSKYNVGRQMFSPVDIGDSKSRVLVSRINAFYGIDWKSECIYFQPYIDEHRTSYNSPYDMIISCVDSVSARKEIKGYLVEARKNNYSFRNKTYWLDLGNANSTGQVILGLDTNLQVKKNSCSALPDIFDYFPDLEAHEIPDAPSCSMREALVKQDLFVNQSVATDGLSILWKMFRYGRIEYHGCFSNQANLTTKPISVQNSFNRFYKLQEAA